LHPLHSTEEKGKRCLSGTALRSPKQPGESCLKPAKNKNKTHLLLKHTHRARPTPRWPPRPTGVAQSKAPSSRFRLARMSRLPRAGSASLEGQHPPRAGSASLEGTSPPRSRPPHKRACSRTRVWAFNALTRQSRAITRLGVTPRRCSANSLGETHPRHRRELCGTTSVSPVALCCPLPYG
jgi:hypothetical protein